MFPGGTRWDGEKFVKGQDSRLAALPTCCPDESWAPAMNQHLTNLFGLRERWVVLDGKRKALRGR